MRTCESLIAKCTKAPLGKLSRGSALPWPFGLGWRSKRYWSTASSTDWVKSVFSSPVPTGTPFRNSTRSRLFSLFREPLAKLCGRRGR